MTATELQVHADGLQAENARLRARVELLEWAVGVYRGQLRHADESFAVLLEHREREAE